MKKIMMAAICSAAFLSPFASAEKSKTDIPGYSYGSAALAMAPYSPADLETLKATVLFTEEDAKWLRKSRQVLEP